METARVEPARTPKRRRPLLAAVVVVALGGTAAGVVWTRPGPLQVSSGASCLPIPFGAGATARLLALRNASGSPVRLEAVEVVDGRNVEVLDTLLVRDRGERRLFLGDEGYPPRAASFLEDHYSAAWEARTPAVGAQVAPVAEEPDHISYDHSVYLGLRRTGTELSSVPAVRITYSTRWRTRSVLVPTNVTLFAECDEGVGEISTAAG